MCFIWQGIKLSKREYFRIKKKSVSSPGSCTGKSYLPSQGRMLRAPVGLLRWLKAAKSLGSRTRALRGRGGHSWNPSYSGGRHQEDGDSRPARANSSGDPISKKIHHKKRLVEWLKWQNACLASTRPWVQTTVLQKKKKKKKPKALKPPAFIRSVLCLCLSLSCRMWQRGPDFTPRRKVSSKEDAGEDTTYQRQDAPHFASFTPCAPLRAQSHSSQVVWGWVSRQGRGGELHGLRPWPRLLHAKSTAK
jgi:hypothetical protein